MIFQRKQKYPLAFHVIINNVLMFKGAQRSAGNSCRNWISLVLQRLSNLANVHGICVQEHMLCRCSQTQHQLFYRRASPSPWDIFYLKIWNPRDFFFRTNSFVGSRRSLNASPLGFAMHRPKKRKKTGFQSSLILPNRKYGNRLKKQGI